MISALLIISSPARAQALQRFQTIRSDPRLQAQLAQIVDTAVRRALGKEAALPEGLDPVFQRPMGVFVTAKRGDEVRGCMGSLQPKQGSLAEEIVKNLDLAFTRDPRHRPIRQEELPGMEIYLSAVGDPQPVFRWDALSPARDGILLKSGSKEAVVLPGEAKTLRYLLAFAKAKAGIRRGEAYQLYRLPAEVLSVALPVR